MSGMSDSWELLQRAALPPVAVGWKQGKSCWHCLARSKLFVQPLAVELREKQKVQNREARGLVVLRNGNALMRQTLRSMLSAKRWFHQLLDSLIPASARQ